jgi:hypothetical protein
MALQLPGLVSHKDGGRVVVHPRPTLKWIAEKGLPWAKAQGAARLNLDDVSLAAANDLIDLEPVYPKTADRYTALSSRVTAVFNGARQLGIAVVAGAHVRTGRFDRERKWHQGGPDLKGNETLKAAVYPFDFCAMLRKASEGSVLHAEFYVPGVHDEDWATKDRYDVFHRGRQTAPANLREYLRAAGVILPRFPGLEWQERVADAVAEKVLRGASHREAWVWAVEKLRSKNLNPRHVRWAIEDGIARAVYADPVLSDPLYLPPEAPAAALAGAVTDLEGDAPQGTAAEDKSASLE